MQNLATHRFSTSGQSRRNTLVPPTTSTAFRDLTISSQHTFVPLRQSHTIPSRWVVDRKLALASILQITLPFYESLTD
jgi:hypothetical protein